MADATGRPSYEERRARAVEISDITAEEFDALQDFYKERRKTVLNVGDDAPDFTADYLERGRKRTGETMRLSEMKGKPVGIIFGSYT